MAIGGGILPQTGSSQFTELTYVTRRAFILNWLCSYTTVRL